jgi:hypothetical protein
MERAALALEQIAPIVDLVMTARAERGGIPRRGLLPHAAHAVAMTHLHAKRTTEHAGRDGCHCGEPSLILC